MKYLLIILTISFLTSCSYKRPSEIEKDVFISAFDTGFDSSGKAKLKSNFQAIYFGKDFWNYFIRTHPRTSSIIFISPLYDTTKKYASLADTSYNFYDVTIMSSFFLTKMLADNVTGREKLDQLDCDFFVVPDEATVNSAKEKGIDAKLNKYTAASTVEKEFNQFKRILTRQDTAEHYVIVFKKGFVDRIYELYE
nr:hypothetical protein [uncultured Flavobacterium sp.]